MPELIAAIVVAAVLSTVGSYLVREWRRRLRVERAMPKTKDT